MSLKLKESHLEREREGFEGGRKGFRQWKRVTAQPTKERLFF